MYVVQACLGKLSLLWEYFCEFEKLAHTGVFMEGTLKGIVWPGLVWVREQLIVLAGCNFGGAFRGQAVPRQLVHWVAHHKAD